MLNRIQTSKRFETFTEHRPGLFLKQQWSKNVDETFFYEYLNEKEILFPVLYLCSFYQQHIYVQV